MSFQSMRALGRQLETHLPALLPRAWMPLLPCPASHLQRAARRSSRLQEERPSRCQDRCLVGHVLQASSPARPLRWSIWTHRTRNHCSGGREHLHTGCQIMIWSRCSLSCSGYAFCSFGTLQSLRDCQISQLVGKLSPHNLVKTLRTPYKSLHLGDYKSNRNCIVVPPHTLWRPRETAIKEPSVYITS